MYIKIMIFWIYVLLLFVRLKKNQKLRYTRITLSPKLGLNASVSPTSWPRLGSLWGGARGTLVRTPHELFWLCGSSLWRSAPFSHYGCTAPASVLRGSGSEPQPAWMRTDLFADATRSGGRSARHAIDALRVVPLDGGSAVPLVPALQGRGGHRRRVRPLRSPSWITIWKVRSTPGSDLA